MPLREGEEEIAACSQPASPPEDRTAVRQEPRIWPGLEVNRIDRLDVPDVTTTRRIDGTPIPAEDRHQYALRGLTEIYGDGIRQYFTGAAQTESWIENYYSFGEAAVFSPSQMTALHPYIQLPEGPLHFVGEHTSLKHAWIEGAIESGTRAALEIHDRVKARRNA
jgi:hypothetical protein